MKKTYARVLPGLFIAFGIVVRANGALSEGEHQLLEAVQTSRQTTFATIAEGHGIATLFESRDDSSLGGSAVSIGPIQVKFAFSGRNNIYWETDGSTGKLLRSGMTKDDRRTLYSSTAGRPYWVQIDRFDASQLHGPFMDEELDNWSFAEFSRLPWNSSDATEEMVFATMGKLRDAAVDLREEKVTYSGAAGPSNDREELKAVFDLKLGGMIRSSSYGFEKINSDGTRASTLRTESLEWTIVGNRITPTRRRVDVRQMDHGKLQVTGALVVAITQFQIDKVEPSELDIKNMGIPVGTPVMDHVAGLQYEYGRDTGIRTGGIPVNATPNIESELAEDPTTDDSGLFGRQHIIWMFSIGAVVIAVLFGIGILNHARKRQ